MSFIMHNIFLVVTATAIILAENGEEFQTVAAREIIYPEMNSEANACVTPVGAEGRCVRLDLCPALMNLLKARPLPLGVSKLLQDSGCGWVGNFPKVCCLISNVKPVRKTTINPIIVDELSTSTSAPPGDPFTTVLPGQELETLGPQDKEDGANTGEGGDSEGIESQVTQHLGSGVSNEGSQSENENTDSSETELPLEIICGLGNIADRIFGGQEAALGEYPWAAALAYGDSTKFTFQCGGALVNSWYVVTAAHCVRDGDGKLLNLAFVRLGDHNLFSEDDGAETVDYEPDIIIPHSNYTRSPEILYDIALIRLKKKVQFTAFIGPVCLPKESGPSIPLTSQEETVVTGWGRNEVNITSPVLQEVKIPVVPNTECKDLYHEKGVLINIYDNQLCAGEQGKDSCSGDSGGPLTVINNLQYYLQGVISFGTVHCDGRLPGVYTRVTSYLDWLNENMVL